MSNPTKPIIAFDTETYYDKDYSVKTMGPSRYCRDSRFECYMVSVYDGESAWSGHPKDLNWGALSGAVWLSHNQTFDQTVYEEMVKRGQVPAIQRAGWKDTSHLSAYLCNRRSLKEACEFLLGVKLTKDVRDQAKGKRWGDFTSEDREAMLNYARSDAVHCYTLWAKYGHLWPEKEQRLSEMTIEQGMRGVQIDTELLKEYIVISTQMLQKTEDLLPWIKEGRPPTSPKAMAEYCRAADIPCAPIKSHFDDGEARYTEWEQAYGKKHPWISNVSSWRSINKFLDSLRTIEERVEEDGILKFGTKYAGAHTLRWAGDAGINFQNFRKVPLFRDEQGLLISDAALLKEISNAKSLPGFVTASLDIRKLLVPRPGMRMVVSDLSQIEPRCLAKIVGDDAMLANMAAGYSPYEAAARARGEWTSPEPLKSGDKELYALKKAQILALGYGAGPDKFELMAKELAGLDLSAQDPEFIQTVSETGEPCIGSDGKPIIISGKGSTAKRIVKEWRDANPGVTSLWKQLDTALKNSAGGTFEMELPSGRSMRYGQVRNECRTVRNEETGALERRWVKTADIGGRRYKLYGGALVENLIQAVARDVFCEALLRIEKIPGVHILWTVHDEVVAEIENGVDPEEIDRAMSETPPWFAGCPVSAETQVVSRYTK